MNINLTHASLRSANLSGATLLNANLTSADLFAADLRNAKVIGSNLYRTRLNSADLAYTTFIPFLHTEPGTQLPEFILWQFAHNIGLISVPANAISRFYQLREDFKRNGLRPEERGFTAALQRAETRRMNWLEGSFRYVAFDLTSVYGDSPGRVLMILIVGILNFAWPYTAALTRKNPSRGAIWRVWNEDRLLDVSDGGNDRKRRECLFGFAFFKAVRYGHYFSLLSAFHIGWRDLNVGHWIARIQPREYALRPTGWVRVVSGLQSLFSIYLLALLVLTYFGRPFE
jgi:hypothetical protein